MEQTTRRKLGKAISCYGIVHNHKKKQKIPHAPVCSGTRTIPGTRNLARNFENADRKKPVIRTHYSLLRRSKSATTNQFRPLPFRFLFVIRRPVSHDFSEIQIPFP